MAVVLVYFDGACEPENPGGLMTWGFVVRDLPGFQPVYGSGFVDPAGLKAQPTNNFAEYVALGKALAWLQANAAHLFTPKDELVIAGDSKLVVMQLKGDWKCSADTLVPLRKRCIELLGQMRAKWSVLHVPREQNALADMLAQAAFVGRTGQAFPHREPNTK